MARRHVGLVVGGLLCAMLAGCESGLQQQEATYRYRLEKLDAIATTAPEPLRAALAARRQELVAAYGQLPPDEGPRGEGLGGICQKLNGSLEEFTQKAAAAADEAARQRAAAAAAEGVRHQAQLVGRWQGGGRDLTVAPDGHVTYARTSGVIKKNLEGSLARCSSTGFDVSVLGLTTTFTVQAWPHEDAGTWKMRLDDTDVVRVAAP